VRQSFLSIGHPLRWKGRRISAVEFGSFREGAIGAQKWVNFIVSTRYEAETGERPYHPWQSLPSKTGQA